MDGGSDPCATLLITVLAHEGKSARYRPYPWDMGTNSYASVASVADRCS